MNVLVLGSGGREYALAWKIAQSKSVNKIYIAPGNAGTDAIGENININIADFNIVKDTVLKLNIEMVVAGSLTGWNSAGRRGPRGRHTGENGQEVRQYR